MTMTDDNSVDNRREAVVEHVSKKWMIPRREAAILLRNAGCQNG